MAVIVPGKGPGKGQVTGPVTESVTPKLQDPQINLPNSGLAEIANLQGPTNTPAVPVNISEGLRFSAPQNLRQQPIQQKQQAQQDATVNQPQAKPSSVYNQPVDTTLLSQQNTPTQQPNINSDSVMSGYAPAPAVPETTASTLNAVSAPNIIANEEINIQKNLVDQQQIQIASPIAEEENRLKEVASQPQFDVDGLPVSRNGIVANPEPIVRRPESVNNSNLAFAKYKNNIEAKSKAAGFIDGPGNVASETLVGSNNVPLDAISFGSDSLVAAYKQPRSMLRNILSEYNSVYDQEKMLTDNNYAAEILMKLFNENDIRLLVTKDPVPDPGSSHVRRVISHKGSTLRLHPLSFEAFKADTDGDTAKVFFDRNETIGVRSAMDFLIGTDGTPKLSDDLLNLLYWGDKSMVKEFLEGLISDKAVPPKLVSELASIIHSIQNGTSADNYTLANWIRKVADTRGRDQVLSDRIASLIIRYIWDFNSSMMTAMAYMNMADNNYKAPLNTVDQADALPFSIAEDLILGSSPANLYDYNASIKSPIGQVKNKNIHFRMDASVAKRIKADPSLIIGINKWAKSQPYNIDVSRLLETDTWSGDAEEILAKQMSGRIAHGEAQVAPATYLRVKVMRKVGGPNSARYKGNFNLFIKEFSRWFNYYAQVHNAAATEFKADGTILTTSSRSSSVDKVSLIENQKEPQEVAAAFYRVYGEITVDTLFGNDAPIDSKGMTLNEWVFRSRSRRPSNKGEVVTNVKRFLEYLKDRRTSFAATYDKQLSRALENNVGVASRAKSIKLFDKNGNKKYTSEYNLAIESLYLLGSEMFNYYGVGSPQAFLSTDIGKKMIEAKTADALGGILYEMVGKYKMDKVYSLQSAIDNSIDPVEIAELTNQMESELDRISSSSDTWNYLINDFRSGGNAIKEILTNDSIGRNEKEMLLNEAQKYVVLDNGKKVHRPGGNVWQAKWEVASELMSTPKGLYAGSKFLTDFGHRELLDNIKASNSLIDAYNNENHIEITKQVREAKPRKSNNEFTNFMKNVSEGYPLVKLDLYNYISAVYSGMEKTYKSSEKSKQENAVNALYASICQMKNGGAWSDLTICDDFFLGSIAVDRFIKSPILIAKILTNKNYSIRVYDGKGSTIVSQETLGINDSEESLWRFLEQNPRIAMAFRETVVIGGDKGRATSRASLTLKQTMNKAGNTQDSSFTSLTTTEEKIFNQLVDHPGFSAYLSLTTPLTGMKKRQIVEPAMNNISEAINVIRHISLVESESIPSYVDELFRPVFEAQIDSFIGNLTDVESDYYAVNEMTDYFINTMINYSLEVKEMNLPDPPPITKTLEMHIQDQSNVRAYFDIIQTLSGSKTSLSTGVNGAESQRNGTLAFLAQHIPPASECNAPEAISISVDDFQKNWKDYDRHRTGDGQIINESTYQDLINNAVDGVITVENPAECTASCPCQRHSMADPSSSSSLYAEQMTALARFLIDKRSYGTEELNLKVKTLGDDHTDSIVKVDIFKNLVADGWQKTISDVVAAYDAGGISEARETLANLLQDSNEELKYTQFNHGDYVNLAHYMIRKSGETIDVISIGQISQIIKTAVSEASKNASLSFEEIVDTSVAALTNFDSSTQIDIDSILSMVKVNREGKNHTNTVEQRRSSFDRNLVLVEELFKESGVDYRTDSVRLAEYYKTTFRNDYYKLVPYGYDLFGVIEKDSKQASKVVSPKGLWILNTDNQAVIEKAIRDAENIGMNILFYNMNASVQKALNATGFALQTNLIENDMHLLPMFDIRLNGKNTIGDEGGFNTGVYQIDPSNITRMVEDTYNLFNLGDSEVQPMASFVERVNPTRQGKYSINLDSMFSNLRERHPNQTLYVKQPTKADIQQSILWSSQGKLNIDLGELVADTDAEYTKMTEAINRYFANFEKADAYGYLPNSNPDEVVGWVKALCGNEVAWHPIRMYDMREGKGSPRNFNISEYAFDSQRSELTISWSYESESFLGKSFKLLESWFSANKMMTRDMLPENSSYRELKSGNPIDFYVGSFSTLGRRLTYKRQQAMSTLMAESRMDPHGYNFADVPGVLPNNELIREGLSEGSLRLGDWKNILAHGPIEFFPASDLNKVQMDAFMNKMAKDAIKAGVNPSDVFASRYKGIPTYHWFRFNVIFSSSIEFQNNLMYFFNFMDETICPPSIDGDSSNTLFNGNLQMLVPYTDDNGNVFHSWSYVYTGLHFLDNHFSDYSVPGVKGMNKSLSVSNTLLLAGKKLRSSDVKNYLSWATSDVAPALSEISMLFEDEESGE